MGCDVGCHGCWRRLAYFNPRTPVGCDKDTAEDADLYEISIHAPQWGATGSFLFFDWLDVISIHAPQWGATAPWMVRVSSRVFQSTHPSGVRRGPADITPTALPIFQSTHPSGVRHSVNSAIIQYLIFQSTHPSGVRRSRSGTRGCLRDFNPRTPVGCDFAR